MFIFQKCSIYNNIAFLFHILLLFPSLFYLYAKVYLLIFYFDMIDFWKAVFLYFISLNSGLTYIISSLNLFSFV